MKQLIARVISKSEPVRGTERSHGRSIRYSQVITLDCMDIASEAKPGQFVMVNCGENTLPRPFSINRVTDDGELSLYFSVLENGTGTEWLSGRNPDDEVKILGPLGNGFTLERTSHNILLVAGGMGIAPLVFLAGEAVKKKINVTLLYGTPGSDRYPVDRILPDIEIISATEDGSKGYHGMITDLIPDHIDNADQVLICGPAAMYGYIDSEKDRLLRGKQAQVSLEARMACGRGVCYGCTVRTKNGNKRVCEDGPVFDLNVIEPDSICL